MGATEAARAAPSDLQQARRGALPVRRLRRARRRLLGRLRPHKSGQEVLGCYRQIRMRYRPEIRIYLIADNLSPHKTPDIRAWATENNIELVFTPTYASFLNRIECHFWAIREFVVTTPTTPTGMPSRRRWPTTSSTATAPTATSA